MTVTSESCFDKQHAYRINVLHSGLQIDNFGVPIDNIKNNYELYDVLYDPNIKFNEAGHFICDFMNSGNV